MMRESRRGGAPERSFMPSLSRKIDALPRGWYPGAPSPELTRAILAYRYVTPTSSLVERAFLNAFWEKAVLLVPRSVAPNTLTLMGGGICIAIYVLDWLLSPDGLGTARPTWLYALFALLFFLYQTLDGVDGKQARRTKSGSALGEIMDHGVDAIATGLVALISADTFGFGLDSFVPWISAFGSQMAFYTSNLTLVHRGSQKFLNIDITELQWGLILCWIATGVAGPGIWRGVVAVPEVVAPLCDVLGPAVFGLPAGPRPGLVEIRFIAAVIGVGGTVANFFLYSLNALPPYLARARPAHVVAGAPGTGLGQLALQVVGISTYGALAFVAQRRFATIPEAALRHDALRALLLGSCFAFGDQVNRLLLMRVAHHRVPFVSPALVLMSGFAALSFVDLTVRWWWAVAAACVVAHQLLLLWIARTFAQILKIAVFRTRSSS